MGHSDDMVVLSTPESLLVLFMFGLVHQWLAMPLLPGHAAQATPQMSSASSGGSSRGEVKCFVDR